MRAREIHAGLQLLDRQVVRVGTGGMVCKVDDLELQGDPPYVSAILAGPLALGPRVGGLPGWLMVQVTRLFRPEEDPQPRRIPMHLVNEIGSAVVVGGEPAEPALERWLRENVIARIPGSGGEGPPYAEPEHATGHAPRISALLGRRVTDAEGTVVGKVADVRLCQDGPLLHGVQNAFRIAGLVVVPERTGKLFGYERGPGGQAPWLVRAVITRWFSGSALVGWDQVDASSARFETPEVRLTVPARDLAPLTDLYEREPRG
uniref:hypothetical protein n=1 Tax=Nonomuraea pusilla TaxID=46177 RepID=UPI0006E4564E|nr:hypothetical protein [Nonomuraea pusilla]